jgi:hypothetical protein
MIENENAFPKGNSLNTFRSHVLALENFLMNEKIHDLKGEPLVYLAGMIARKFDRDYSEDIKPFLFSDPSEMDLLIRKHELYIGQNAPVAFAARINAEYLTISIATQEKSIFSRFQLAIPARFFRISSNYFYYSGNKTLGAVLDYFGKELSTIIKIIHEYLTKYSENFPENNKLENQTWTKFGTELNDRNSVKEYLEKKNISEDIPYDSRVEIKKIFPDSRGQN